MCSPPWPVHLVVRYHWSLFVREYFPVYTYKFSNMKKFLFLALAVMLFASCQKEGISDNKAQLDALSMSQHATAKKARPLSGNLSNAPVPGYPAANCSDIFTVSGRNFIYGNVSHLGVLQSGSFGTVQACNFFVDGTVTYKEVWVAANGDELYMDSYILVSPDPVVPNTGTWTGAGTITGGTGRFAGASGNWTFANTNYYADGTSTWSIAGEIVY